LARILLLGSGALADALAREIASLCSTPLVRAEVPPSSQPFDLVVDTGRPTASRPIATHLGWVRAALESGAHWVDLARDRERVIGVRALDELAKERGRVALSGAGFFPGWVEPFVRARLADLKRVNEVLIGFALGAGAGWDESDFADLLGGYGRPIAMSIGGEQTQREFLGDTRWFEHPAPVGLRHSSNVDAPDLALYLEKPYRAAGVRLSFAVPTRSAERSVRFALWLHRRGFAKNLVARARRLAQRAGGRAGASGAPTSLTISVRGIDAKSLPLERRIAFQSTRSTAELEALSGVLAARAALGLAGATPQSPGARPAAGLVDDTGFEAYVKAHSVDVRRGDLGGWRG